ncbi:hypothetical protein MTO96_031328, partial [Rhipicephalus appendiculatus]
MSAMRRPSEESRVSKTSTVAAEQQRSTDEPARDEASVPATPGHATSEQPEAKVRIQRRRRRRDTATSSSGAPSVQTRRRRREPVPTPTPASEMQGSDFVVPEPKFSTTALAKPHPPEQSPQ